MIDEVVYHPISLGYLMTEVIITYNVYKILPRPMKIFKNKYEYIISLPCSKFNMFKNTQHVFEEVFIMKNKINMSKTSKNILASIKAVLYRQRINSFF